MSRPIFTVTAPVWLYEGMAAWHFVTIPKELADVLTGMFSGWKRGFGSLPVEVTIGATTWQTSIFPDKRSQGYLLPLKAVVRKKEGIKVGDTLKFTLSVLV